MVHSDEEYTDFEATLDLFFERWGEFDKDMLKDLMTSAGFRRKKIDGKTQIVQVNENQLDYAWKHYKNKFKQGELDVLKKNYYITDKSGRKRLRAGYEQDIKGKVYRKGQFIPKVKKQ